MIALAQGILSRTHESGPAADRGESHGEGSRPPYRCGELLPKSRVWVRQGDQNASGPPSWVRVATGRAMAATCRPRTLTAQEPAEQRVQDDNGPAQDDAAGSVPLNHEGLAPWNWEAP